MDGFRSLNPVHEPKLGELLRLPDGSGPGGSSTGPWPTAPTRPGTCSSSSPSPPRRTEWRRRSGPGVPGRAAPVEMPLDGVAPDVGGNALTRAGRKRISPSMTQLLNAWSGSKRRLPASAYPSGAVWALDLRSASGVMRMRGLEPPRAEAHTDLNRARLPIPPHPRGGQCSRGTSARTVRERTYHAAPAPLPAPARRSALAAALALLAGGGSAASPRPSAGSSSRSS